MVAAERFKKKNMACDTKKYTSYAYDISKKHFKKTHIKHITRTKSFILCVHSCIS